VPLEELRDGVPVAGWYSIRVLAEAKFRYADMDAKKCSAAPRSLTPANRTG
jgi:hypothetical protein